MNRLLYGNFRRLNSNLVRQPEANELVSKIAEESRLFSPDRIGQPSGISLFTNKKEIISTDTLVVKNKVSTFAKRRFLALLLFGYIFMSLFAYQGYKNNVVYATKYGCPDWALFNNMDKRIFEFFDFPITDLDGLSAMHWAALNDNVNLAQKLIKCGDGDQQYVDVNRTSLARPSHDEALWVFVFSTCYVLDRYFNQNLTQLHGYLSDFEEITPLHCAAWAGSYKIVEYLLSLPTIEIAKTDKHGTTAFGMAIKQCNFDIARLLIQKMENFDIDQRNTQGYTLLHAAAADGNFQTVKFLVDNGADITKFGPCGLTAAGWCEERHYKIRRSEMENSKWLPILNYLEEKMEEKGILEPFQID